MTHLPPSDDEIRDNILRHLYQVHQTAKGPKKVAIGIKDLKKALKEKHDYKQNVVVSNLDYLVQKEWIAEVVQERTFQTPSGTTQVAHKTTYKISHLGIDRMQKASLYQRSVGDGVNITNIQGVTVVGENNIVNTHFADLSRVLGELRTEVQHSDDFSDTQKLDIAADLDSLRTQLQKPKPNHSVIKTLWSGIEAAVTATGFAEMIGKAKSLIAPLIG